MNTPAHLIFGLSAFAKADAPRVTAAAFAGALIPDLSLYLLAGMHLVVLGTDPQVVFGQLYFSEGWQAVFRVDNSAVLWGMGLVFAIWARSAWAMALCGAALLHLGLDFLFHHDDGRAHFWPLTTWIFQSPVSYWDTNHHAGIVGPIEIGLSLLCCGFLWHRFKGRPMRVLIVALGVLEAAPVFFWAFVFAGG